MRIVKGLLVNDHILKIIWHIEELARLNLFMNNKLAVDLIFQSLPNFFFGFVQNFHVHKMEKNLIELLVCWWFIRKKCTTQGPLQ